MATSNSSAGASASTSASAPSSRQTIQLQKNLESLKNNPLPFVRDLELRAGEAGNEMTGTMIGPENTPYAGRDLEFIIKFVPEYPFKQPLVHFLTAISHPNVSKKDGFACHDQMMSQWKPLSFRSIN
ncbi:hypothetical protein I4U23_029811 [Adineta vaga]|nr:hypothetical protein I4U23_029811 [Adineta vaga]